MVYVVQAGLAFRNAARRDAISSNIQARLAQTVPFGEVDRVDWADMGGNPATILSVAFRTLAEADSFWADVVVFVGSGINGPVAGSSMWRHDCPRDEAQTAGCVVADVQAW